MASDVGDDVKRDPSREHQGYGGVAELVQVALLDAGLLRDLAESAPEVRGIDRGPDLSSDHVPALTPRPPGRQPLLRLPSPVRSE